MNKKMLSILLILVCIFSFSCIMDVKSFASTTDEVYLKIGNVDAIPNNESTVYEVERGEKIVITAKDPKNVTWLGYQIGKVEERDSVYKECNSLEFTLPTNLADGLFSLQIMTWANNKWGTSQIYHLKMMKPDVNIQINGSDIKTNTKENPYEVLAGQTLYMKASPDTSITRVSYKIGYKDQVTKAGTSASIVIPIDYVTDEQFDIQVFAYSPVLKDWTTIKKYYFKIIEPKIVLEYKGTKLTNDTIETAKEVTIGDTINITTDQGVYVDEIKYKFEGKSEQTINSFRGTITIPEYEAGKTFKLEISAKTLVGAWSKTRTVYFKTKQIEQSNNAILTVTIDEEVLKQETQYNIEEGKKILITVKPNDNVKRIYYKFDTDEPVFVEGSTTTVDIPTKYTNTKPIKFQVVELYKDNAYGNKQDYIFNITKKDTNIIYPVIVKEDEEFNAQINSLAISLRTNPIINKDGNQNFFKVNENIQYNIDYINGTGEKIEEKVYVYFKIPSNVSATVIDLKGGTLVDAKTIKWEFNGLEKNEKGTIPVILKYTSTSNNSEIIKPYAQIESNSNSDLSGVINLIYRDNDLEIETNHKAYMYGDEGTNTFRPNEGINRAEVAAVLVRIFNIPLVNDYIVTYNDAETIAQGRYVWAEQAIMSVTKYGLMEGYDDGEFKPGENVTKAQLITILTRKIAIDNNSNDLFVIKDEPIKLFNNISTVYSSYGYSRHWAAKYIAQMLRLNMLPHFSNTIDGNVDLTITRGEVTKLIDLMLLRGPSVDSTSNNSLTNKFIDVNSNTQFYEYIIEATANKHNSLYSENGYETMIK